MSSTDHSINSHALTFVLDVVTGRWVCSPAMRDLYGLAPDEEATTEVMTERMVAEDREPMLARFWYHASHAGVFQYEYRIRDGQGRVRHLVLVGETEAVAGEARRMSGHLVDISDTLDLRAEAAVTASAENRAVIEQCKGMLMAGFGLSEDAAFALLRKASNDHNVRLADVSRRIVAMFDQPGFRPDAQLALQQLLLDWP